MGELSVFGPTGYIGSRFLEQSVHKCVPISRDKRFPLTHDVLYFIGTTHEHWMLTDIHIDVDTNLSILVEVLDEWRKIAGAGVFNFVSTWFVYGDVELPAKETSPCRPVGFYSVTKYAAERLIESYCKVYRMRYRILRLVNVIGGHDPDASAKKNALQYLCGLLATNQDVYLYHDGRFIRDYIHVDDAVRAIDTVIQEMPSNMIVNIGGGRPVEFRSLIEFAKGYLVSKSAILPWSPWPAPTFHQAVQQKDFWADVSLLRSTGFSPRYTATWAIRDMCDRIRREGG